MNNMKHKILMTLALLITAVTGAWAQDPDYDISVDFDRQYNPNSGLLIYYTQKQNHSPEGPA